MKKLKKVNADEAISGFRFYFANPYYLTELYSKMGRESPLLCRMYKDGYISDPTASEVLREDKIYQKNKLNIERWVAADRVVKSLACVKDGDDKYAVLYSSYGKSKRICIDEMTKPISERTVYNWLEALRLIWWSLLPKWAQDEIIAKKLQ
jgi:hypothetical protein